MTPESPHVSLLSSRAVFGARARLPAAEVELGDNNYKCKRTMIWWRLEPVHGKGRTWQGSLGQSWLQTLDTSAWEDANPPLPSRGAAGTVGKLQPWRAEGRQCSSDPASAGVRPIAHQDPTPSPTLHTDNPAMHMIASIVQGLCEMKVVGNRPRSFSLTMLLYVQSCHGHVRLQGRSIVGDHADKAQRPEAQLKMSRCCAKGPSNGTSST